MVLAFSQDTWDSMEKAKGFRQGLPPWWSSGATASVKALENGSWEPGQATLGYRAWRKNWTTFPFPLSWCQGSAKQTTSGYWNCYREATGPQGQKRWDGKKDIFGEQCASNGGGVSVPRGSYGLVQIAQGPHRRPLLWPRRAATAINFGYQPILVGVPMAGFQRQGR